MNDINLHVNGEVYLMPTAKDCDARSAEQDASGATANGDVKTHDMSKFLKMGDNLQLYRFRGNDFVNLIGRIPSHDGLPPTCYEIHVAKDASRMATAYRNGKILFTITGPVNTSLIENMAVSALHRWYKQTRVANRRSRKSAKRNKAEGDVK